MQTSTLRVENPELHNKPMRIRVLLQPELYHNYFFTFDKILSVSFSVF